MRYSLCNHWEFTEQWSDAFCRGEPVGCRPVRLPHTCRELPLHYADPSDYEMVCGYRRTLTVPDATNSPDTFHVLLFTWDKSMMSSLVAAINTAVTISVFIRSTKLR